MCDPVSAALYHAPQATAGGIQHLSDVPVVMLANMDRINCDRWVRYMGHVQHVPGVRL